MVKWGPIGKEVYERTYSRDTADGNKETWDQTVARVVRGNVSLTPGYIENDEEETLREYIENFKIMPAGRHLWSSGVEGRQFLFNCHRAGWTEKLSDHFCFVFDELMKGGGVGSNYSDCYMERAGVVRQPVQLFIKCVATHENIDEFKTDSNILGTTIQHVCAVDDSREGWVRALRLLIDSHFGGPAAVTINVSAVRPRGTPIKGFGGIAAGPGPLVDVLRSANKLLNGAVGRRISSLEAMQLDHDISRCVIAGNVRRSARMSMKHWKDPDILEFVNCKSDNGSHWSTNISVEVDDEFFGAYRVGDGHAISVRDAIVAGMYRNGEPGIFNSSQAKKGERGDVRCTNPCGEIALEEWENCNLGHLNLAVLSYAELFEAARLMTRYLIRATFSDITSKKQREVVDRNRRIGVGIYGFQEWLIAGGEPFGVSLNTADTLSALRMYIREVADEYSAELGIPSPIKCTTVAPTGTIAKLSGHSEGIHPIYAKHFLRNVRYADNDPNLEELAKSWNIEDCIYSSHTKVVQFVCEDEIYRNVPPEHRHLIRSVDEIPLEVMLDVQEQVQRCWADNAVSFTVNFNPEVVTENQIRYELDRVGQDIKGTTLMPDESRLQAPFVRISEEAFMHYHGNTLYDASFDECASGACPVK